MLRQSPPRCRKLSSYAKVNENQEVKSAFDAIAKPIEENIRA